MAATQPDLAGRAGLSDVHVETEIAQGILNLKLSTAEPAEQPDLIYPGASSISCSASASDTSPR
jgi:hypothetical protein